MKIKDIYIGEVDAKNELIKQKRNKLDLFMKSFSVPKQIGIEDYVSGQKYFIHGLKGAGKTALLRHTRHIDQERLQFGDNTLQVSCE